MLNGICWSFLKDEKEHDKKTISNLMFAECSEIILLTVYSDSRLCCCHWPCLELTQAS